MTEALRLLVFTDLDGTLLDDAYRFAGAEAALARLAKAQIPLVLATSKTRAELTTLSAQLPGVPGLIFENGAGITCPSPGGPQTTLFGPGSFVIGPTQYVVGVIEIT